MRFLGQSLAVFAGLLLSIGMWLVTGQPGNLVIWLAAFVATSVVVSVSLVVRKLHLRRPKAVLAPVVYLPRSDERGTTYRSGRRAA